MSKLTDFAQNLLVQRDYSTRTVETYLHWIQRLEDHYPNQDLSDLSREDVARFFQHLSKRRLNSQSVRLATSAVKFLLGEVLRKNELCDAVPKISVNRPDANIPTQREVLLIINSIQDIARRAAIKCIYGMGLELQEALSIKIRDIDLSTYKVRVVPQRSKTIRLIPIPLFAIDDLKSVISSRPDNELLFSNKNRTKLGDKILQRTLLDARKKAGITEPYTLRSFRHAYIKHLELLGVPLKDVLHHLGVNKGRALEYYSYLGAPIAEVTFSPSDRTLFEEEEKTSLSETSYISKDRIAQLSELKSQNYDLTRLLAILHEINASAKCRNYFSIAFLCRAIIDHVPPIFGVTTFNEVVNNYQSSKSFKKSMDHLQNSMRNIADGYLHVQIRRTEEVPHFVQVDFRAPLDVLLSEIYRIIKRQK